MVAAEIAVHIRELYQRIEELERRPFLNEAGTWEAGKAYGTGMVVTDHGSAWVCKAPTCQRPGESDAWRLLVKRGRDGKDATEAARTAMTMIEARRKLNAALAEHPAAMENMLFNVCEDGHSVCVICEMTNGDDIVVGFDLPAFVDPDDDDERRRLMAEFSAHTPLPLPTSGTMTAPNPQPKPSSWPRGSAASLRFRFRSLMRSASLPGRIASGCISATANGAT